MPTILKPLRARPERTHHAPTSVVCSACGIGDSIANARLEAWQISRDGQRIHCGPCADLHVVVLDDRVLYWPACGHGDDDEVVLYDRPVCVVCDG